MDINNFKKKPIMGILRGASSDIIEPLVETIISSALETMEITMNTPAASQLIKTAKKVAAKRLTVGAGTVLTMDSLKKALESGATFIVMPVLIRELTQYCVKNKIPVFPGALTAQEIYNAREAGATMVKVFPARFFGPEYLREIKAPLDNIELLACSGVTPLNLKEYFDCGASAVSFGASVFKKEWLAEKDFKSIGEAVKKFIDAFRERNAI